MLALGELDGELLDERGDVVVGDHFALEFLDGQGRVGHLDLKFVFDLDLAAQAPAGLDLLAVEEAGLGGEDLAAAFEDLHFALAAVGLAAAGGREEDLLFGEGVHQVAARGDVKDLLAVVDVDLDCAGRGDLGLDEEEEGHQQQGHEDDDCD